MLRRAYGVDPDETWELDYSLEEGRFTLDALRREVASARADAEREQDPKKRSALEASAAAAASAADKLEADLAAYVPGSGPIFIVGPIPNGKRAEIRGDSLELVKLPSGRERSQRNRELDELVVRWGVRGHRNLLSGRSAKPIPFETEDAPFAGGTRKVVSAQTLEAYGPILTSLALLVLRSQEIDEAGKNG